MGIMTTGTLPAFTPQDPGYEHRIQEIFEQQTVMQTIGAREGKVVPGMVEIELPYNEALSQHHGYLHAGIITTIVDSACGGAALTLSPAGSSVLTVEYKVNFLAPAKGELFIATGRVLKLGKTLTICEGEVRARADGKETSILAMLPTMMILRPT